MVLIDFLFEHVGAEHFCECPFGFVAKELTGVVFGEGRVTVQFSKCDEIW